MFTSELAETNDRVIALIADLNKHIFTTLFDLLFCPGITSEKSTDKT